MSNKPVFTVVDNFLSEQLLNELIDSFDTLVWSKNYSQKGLRKSIVFHNNNYLSNVKNNPILKDVKDFIFSEEKLSFYFKILNTKGANFSIKKIKSIKEKIDINSTEKGLSNSILDKFLAKYVRNIFYKSLTIKKISRYLRRKLFGDKYRITFSINSTNGTYSEAPHIDIRNKIIVGLVYLDDVSTNNSSNITFWQSKVSKLKYDKNLYIKDGNLIKIKDIYPKRNRLVIFKNDDYAIHSANGNLSGERRFIYFSVVASRDF